MIASTQRHRRTYSTPELPAGGFVELKTGSTLSRLIVREEIGRGGQGVVYRAFDSCLEREVALKVVRRGSADADGALTEARMLARVHDPHVVGLFDFARQPDADFLVMELVKGQVVADMRAGAPLRPKEVVSLGAQLARGLHALHSAGIVHRDIKPGNLAFTTTGTLKILDLGVARAVDEPIDAPAEARLVVGTIPYMPPEVLQGDCGDQRSDIWSAGAILFEWATGHRVVETESQYSYERLVSGDVSPRQFSIPATVPTALAETISRALAPLPGKRFQSAMELLTWLTEPAALAEVSLANLPWWRASTAALAV